MMAELFVFGLDHLRIGLHVAAVQRVVCAVEITPLPGAPAIVLGVIDVSGVVMPVVNLRQRLALPDRRLSLEDRFIIVRTARRTLVIIADSVEGVAEYAASQITDPSSLLPGVQQIAGIASSDDGIIFVQDLDQFLSLDEAAALAQAHSANQQTEDGGYGR